MPGHGAKFGRKKDDAIAALLTHRNIEEAAGAVKVSAKTLLRWMKEPKFDAAYRAARRLAFSQSIARLQQASSAAVTTVLKLMVHANAPASTRPGCRHRVGSHVEGDWKTSKLAWRRWNRQRETPTRAGGDDKSSKADCENRSANDRPERPCAALAEVAGILEPADLQLHDGPGRKTPCSSIPSWGLPCGHEVREQPCFHAWEHPRDVSGHQKT